jgi:hypothetical protein
MRFGKELAQLSTEAAKQQCLPLLLSVSLLLALAVPLRVQRQEDSVAAQATLLVKLQAAVSKTTARMSVPEAVGKAEQNVPGRNRHGHLRNLPDRIPVGLRTRRRTRPVCEEPLSVRRNPGANARSAIRK